MAQFEFSGVVIETVLAVITHLEPRSQSTSLVVTVRSDDGRTEAFSVREGNYVRGARIGEDARTIRLKDVGVGQRVRATSAEAGPGPRDGVIVE